MKDNEGYLIIAIGTSYLQMAINCTKTLRLNNDDRPVSVIIKESHAGYARDLNLFDQIFIFFEDNYKSKNLTYFEKTGILSRIDFIDKLNYDKIIILDADILCQAETQHIWDTFNDSGKCLCTIGKIHDDKWHWNFIKELRKSLNLPLYNTQGGLIYINRLHKDFLKMCSLFYYAFNNYEELGFKKLFNDDSMTEEIIWSYCSSVLGYMPYDFKNYPFMTFNPSPESPFCLYEEFDKLEFHKFDKDIVFAHCSWKNDDIIYNRLFYKILLKSSKWDQSIFWLHKYNGFNTYELILNSIEKQDYEKIIKEKTLKYLK